MRGDRNFKGPRGRSGVFYCVIKETKGHLAEMFVGQKNEIEIRMFEG